MSKEMREQINKVKNWQQFLNESFKKDEIFYKLVDSSLLDLILKDGLLKKLTKKTDQTI